MDAAARLFATQQRQIVDALGLDFPTFSSNAQWQRILANRLLSQMPLDSTPKKRKPDKKERKEE